MSKLSSIYKEEESIINELSDKLETFSNENIYSQLKTEVTKWGNNVQDTINQENPYLNNENELLKAKAELLRGLKTYESIQNDFSNYLELDSISSCIIDKKYWEKELTRISKIPEELTDEYTTSYQICRTHLQKQWEKELELQKSIWEIKYITDLRKAYFKKISDWLELLSDLNDTLEELGLDPGYFLDFSDGELSLDNIEQLKKWLDYISENKGVMELCDILGKLRLAEKNKQQETVKKSELVDLYIPDTNSNEEIVGIRIGRDIEHALPQELALLSDDLTSILFDLKYSEGRLMCFDMGGFQAINNERDEIEEIDSDEQGPIIICVDTSGSMSGYPGNIAKAITMYISTRAKEQDRKCYLINFSTSIETLDLSRHAGLGNLMSFLQRSFNGGTDVAPAIKHASEIMEKDDYINSDLLVISDFIMASLSDELIDKISLIKENNNNFYSLAIGDLFLDKSLKSIFDNEWIYNPETCAISSIQSAISPLLSKRLD